MIDVQRTVSSDENSPDLNSARDIRVAVISDAGSERNGVGSYYADLCSHLRPHVEQIELIHPDREDQKRLASRISLPLPGDTTQRLQFPLLRSLSRKLSALRPHVVIIPTPGPFGLVGARMGARYGSRVLIGFHTDYERITDLYWGPIFGRITRGFFEVTNRLLFRGASGTLINSPNVRGSAERLGAPRIQEVGTPISQHFIDPPPPPASGPIQHILYAGRLAEEKNLPAFLEAAHNLPDLNFYIAGDGPLREDVELAGDRLPNLSYLGWVSREDRLPSLMDSCDLLVLPSHVESFGTIALEAMARGRNVLVSSHCGIRQWPKLRDCIYHFAPGESVEGSIRAVCREPEEARVQLAHEARRQALELHRNTLAQWCSILADQGHRSEPADPATLADIHG